jgi:anti-anti-sigma factor
VRTERRRQHPADGTRPNRVEIETPSTACAIVALVGEHDLAEYAPLRDALDLAAARRRNLLIDLTACKFIDSTVVSLLLHARDEVSSDGGTFGVVLPAPGSAVHRLAGVMRFETLFPVHETLSAALHVPPPGPDYFEI